MLSVLCIPSLVINVNNPPSDTEQNEENNSDPTRGVRRVKIGVRHRMPTVAKKCRGQKCDRTTQQHEWVYSITLTATHRPNETELSHHWRERAWQTSRTVS